MKKGRGTKGRGIAIAALLVAIGVMGYAGFQLYKADQVYQEGNKTYDGLRGWVRESPPVQGNTAALPAKEPNVFIPAFSTDFDILKAINNDSAAWLYSPGTEIDYPVMETDNYSYYLSHLPDGTVNANGALFIDYNNAPDFSDPLTVIYGHHMQSGKMFGGLKGYKEQGYFEEHPYMYLYTEQGNYRIDLMYGCVIDAGQWREQAFMFAENTDALIAYAAANTTFRSGLSYAKGDRIVALSTCSYEFDDARYVVIGALRAEY